MIGYLITLLAVVFTSCCCWVCNKRDLSLFFMSLPPFLPLSSSSLSFSLFLSLSLSLSPSFSLFLLSGAVWKNRHFVVNLYCRKLLRVDKYTCCCLSWQPGLKILHTNPTMYWCALSYAKRRVSMRTDDNTRWHQLSPPSQVQKKVDIPAINL